MLRCTSTLPGLRTEIHLLVFISQMFPSTSSSSSSDLFQTTSFQKISQNSATRNPPELPTRSESRAGSIRSTSGGPINQQRGNALQLKLWVLVVMKTSLVASQKMRSEKLNFFLHLKKVGMSLKKCFLWRFITSHFCSLFGVGSGCMLLFRWQEQKFSFLGRQSGNKNLDSHIKKQPLAAQSTTLRVGLGIRGWRNIMIPENLL